MVRANEVEIENGHNAVDTATVKLGELVRLYRKACEDSGRPVKPKSNEDYILQWLHDEFESDFAARLMMQRIVSFAQLRSCAGRRRKAGEGGYAVDMDISKPGTVIHMGSLLGLKPDAAGTARPTLHHLNLIEACKKREISPSDRARVARYQRSTGAPPSRG